MSERRKIISIFSVTLCLLTVFISSGSIAFLYRTSVNEQKERLMDMVMSHARLLEATINSKTHSTADVPDQNLCDSEALAFTLSLFQESIAAYSGAMQGSLSTSDKEKTKSSLQFILARVENDTVYFLNSTGKMMKPTPLKKLLHKPVGKCLSGETGTKEIKDHLGVPVIVAYTPISHTNWALVAKIAITDLKSAFLKTSILVWSVSILMLIIGIFVLLKIINPLIAKIVQSRDEARDATRTKSAFLANMSHEIRTPINGVIGASRLALDEQTSQQMRYYLETINMSAENLLQLTNDILDFSKIEADKLKLENRPFHLHKTVEHAVRTVSLLADKKNIKLSTHIDANVPEAARGDSLRLLQILLNLLSNAVKFTEEGKIAVYVEKKRKMNGRFEFQFTVQDSGAGISPEKIDHIFDSFAQEDSSTTRRYGGTGLGLAICRKLCQLMGGDIHAQSVQGQGSSFIFTAVFHEAELREIQGDSREGNAEDIAIPPLRLLIVEDVLINRKLARMILSRCGHDVTEAPNGLDALTKLANHPFDAILMDVQMPEMDGYTATKIIRSFESGEKTAEILPPDLAEKLAKRLKGTHTPIIALTAHAISGDREECLKSGMDEYLTKPFSPETVSHALKGLINEDNFPSHLKPEPTPVKIRHNIPQGTDPDEYVLNYLRSKYPFDEKKLVQLLEASKLTIAENLLQLEEALSKGNFEQVFPLSHALHGTLLNLGLEGEVEIAKKLVSAARYKEAAPYDEWLTELKEKLSSFLSEKENI